MRSEPGRAPLTWDDIAESAETLDVDVRGLLMEIVSARRTPASAESLGDSCWYLKSVAVAGHVGIGETPLELQFRETAGLTVISARNGVGKTSVVDGIRRVLSNGTTASTSSVSRTSTTAPGRSW